MDKQRYYDRKQYVQQARSCFEEHSEKRKRPDYDYGQEREEADHPMKSYFKCRLVLAAALFAGFCLIRFTGWTYGDISAEAIQSEIQNGISLPESFPQLSDLTAILEKPEE